ncbi:MAG: glycoside hydrolase family 2 TIM barrel-domain containing protein [Elusimicrobiota bacterium]
MKKYLFILCILLSSCIFGTRPKPSPSDNIVNTPNQNTVILPQEDISGKICVRKNGSGQWQLFVYGNPMIIKGVTYAPTKVGLSPDSMPGVQNEWFSNDDNNNQKSDSAYDSWVDLNNNNLKDAEEDAIGDFKLMKDMGVNAIRLYYTKAPYDSSECDKNILRELYNNYGIRVIMGNFLGAYTIGADIAWPGPTDYTNAWQKDKIKKYVRDMVEDHKNEPYILMWVLGNENESPWAATNAAMNMEPYTKFVGEVADMIHEIDPVHPVAVCAWDNPEQYVYYKMFAGDVDIFGVNSYRGSSGFGNLWQGFKSLIDKPMIITEYGCDAYVKDIGENQISQENYHRACWNDILFNCAGYGGQGNSIGGIIFEWADEWWKKQGGYSALYHDTAGPWQGPFPDGWAHEEWFGITAQNNSDNGAQNTISPFQRNLRSVYNAYKNELWQDSFIPSAPLNKMSSMSSSKWQAITNKEPLYKIKE